MGHLTSTDTGPEHGEIIYHPQSACVPYKAWVGMAHQSLHRLAAYTHEVITGNIFQTWRNYIRSYPARPHWSVIAIIWRRMSVNLIDRDSAYGVWSMADCSNAFNKSIVATYYHYSSSHMNKSNTVSLKRVGNNIVLNGLHCAMITVDEAGSNPLSGANR